MTDWRCAIHEAGHVSMAIVQKQSFAYVSIARSPTSRGHLKYYGAGPTPTTERDLHRHICIELAGMAAERHFFGDAHGAAGDESDIAELLERLTVGASDAEKASTRERYEALAAAHVLLHDGEIWALASALCREKTLDEADVKRIIGGTR